MSDIEENVRKRLSNINTLIFQSGFPEDEEQILLARKQLSGILEPAAKDVEFLVVMWEDINTLFKDVVFCKQADRLKKLISDFRHFYVHLEETAIQKSSKIVQTWCEVSTEVISRGKFAVLQWFVAPVVYHIQDKCQPVKRDGTLWTSLFRAVIKHPDQKMLETVVIAMKKPKFKRIFDWKKKWKEGQALIQQIIRVKGLPEDQGKDYWANRNILGVYANIVINIMEQFEQIAIAEMISLDVVELHISYMEKANIIINHLPYRLSPVLPTLQSYKGYIPSLVNRFEDMFLDSDYPWTNPDTDRAGVAFISCVLQSYKEGSRVPDEVNGSLFTIFKHCLEGDVIYTDPKTGEPTIYLTLIRSSLYIFMDIHKDTDSEDVLSQMIPLVLKMMEVEEEAEAHEIGYRFLQMVSQSHQKLFVGSMSNIIHWYKTTKDIEALNILMGVYRDQSSSESLGDDFQILFDASLSDEKNVLFHIKIFREAALKIPEVYTEDNIKKILTFHIMDKILRKVALDTVVAIATGVPERIPADLVLRILFKELSFEEDTYRLLCDIAVNIALKQESHADIFMDEILALCKKCHGPTNCVPLINGLRKMVEKLGPAKLKWHRAYFEELKLNSSHEELIAAVTKLIDVMEGRSIPMSPDAIKQGRRRFNRIVQKKVIEKKVPEKKVTPPVKTESNVKKSTGKKKGLKRKKQNQRESEEEVKDVQIVKKPVMKYPEWFSDVTSLLNPERKRDWRALASQLGYSIMDVEGWATQKDPCLGMLRKWYSTHKTKEDVDDIFKSLQNIERMDAAAIVENTLKVVEGSADEPEVYAVPPSIFISYQWCLQTEVLLLKFHLQMAGYECWTDIGQFGGGEELFEKIDQKINEAKIVICCMSERYLKSPNCIREVKMSVKLDKSTIFLMMEEMKWPPEGSMKPIFNDHLYVRFYERDEEEKTEDTYWPTFKFQELLMLINLEISPDDALLTDAYDEWWESLADEIILKKNEHHKGESRLLKQNKEEGITEIFISYQWSKQTQVKELYRRLTKLGVTCWMDIYQMGGNKPLKEIINRCLRECKIILCCVTSKYALTAHCRREVILADAIKKPLIPLLLEDIRWPPRGPMSNVFSHYKCIEFHSDENIQLTWKGDKFDELLSKMKDKVPEIEFTDDIVSEPDKESHVEIKKEDEIEENAPKKDGNELNSKGGKSDSNEVESVKQEAEATDNDAALTNKVTINLETSAGEEEKDESGDDSKAETASQDDIQEKSSSQNVTSETDETPNQTMQFPNPMETPEENKTEKKETSNQNETIKQEEGLKLETIYEQNGEQKFDETTEATPQLEKTNDLEKIPKQENIPNGETKEKVVSETEAQKLVETTETDNTELKPGETTENKELKPGKILETYNTEIKPGETTETDNTEIKPGETTETDNTDRKPGETTETDNTKQKKDASEEPDNTVEESPQKARTCVLL